MLINNVTWPMWKSSRWETKLSLLKTDIGKNYQETPQFIPISLVFPWCPFSVPRSNKKIPHYI